MKFFQSLFLGVFLAVGLLGTVAILIDFLQGVDTYTWESTRCIIESSETLPSDDDATYVVEVSYRYARRGQEYRSTDFQHGYSGSGDLGTTERLAARYAVGEDVECWVDPDEPESAYLRRANLGNIVWIFVPLLFVAAGGGSLWFLHVYGKEKASASDRSSADPLASIPVPAPGSRAKKPPSPLKTVGLLVGFFGIFFLFGAGFFIPFFVVPALRVVEARTWEEVPCVIISSSVRSHRSIDDDGGPTYSVDVLYRYEIDGREHRSNRYQFMGGSSGGYDGKADVVERLAEGEETTCYVDPDDPFEAVIERGFTTDYLFGLVPLVFVAVGLGGMIFVILGARAVRKQAAQPSWAASLPDARLASVPGAAGPVELEPAMGRVGKLGCAILVALVWNGVTAPFVWTVVKSFREGNPEWFVTVIIIPFVLIGLLILAGIPYAILALVNPKPRVRLSRGALRAGEEVQIEWSFIGNSSRIRRVKIWLECSKTTKETVSTSRGTSLRTRTEPQGTTDIVERHRADRPDSGTVSFTVPEDAVPSSDGDDAIGWKLKFQGDIAFWPDVLEEYPVPMLPSVKGI